MTHKKRLIGILLVLVAIGMVAVLVAACGEEETTTTAAPATTAAPTETTAAPTETTAAPTETTAAPTETTTADLGSYDGPDAQYIGELAEPEMKPDVTFKVGYLNPFASIADLSVTQDAVEAKVKSLGGEFVAFDAGMDVQEQVSQMDQLISLGCDYIIAFPISDASLTQGYASAKAAGINVVQVVTPADANEALNPNVDAMVGLSFDYAAYVTMQYLSENYPGAKVAMIGYAPVSDTLRAIVDSELKWAEEFGLVLLGEIDATDPSPAASSAAAQAIISKYPDVEIILTYGDHVSVAALAAIEAAGKTGEILTATSNGQDMIIRDGVADGLVPASYALPYPTMGEQAVIAGYDLLTEQNLPLPERVLLTGVLATQENVDEIPWIE